MIKHASVLILILFISLTLMGCNPSNKSELETTELLVEEETREEVPTPEDTFDRVKNQYRNEVRVFDVVEHHEPIYSEILQSVSGETEDALKLLIEEKVRVYMDDFFKERIAELLEIENSHYALSEVDEIFESVSRESLYELIVLYEYEYYKTKQ